MIASAFFAYDAATPCPCAAALLPCLGTSLVIHAGTGAETRVARLLSQRWLVFIGLISYSLYLWHWPLLAFLRQAYGSLDLPYAVALAAVALSFLPAAFPWLLIERPFAHRGYIDRASCRARVCRYVLFPWVAVYLKKKKNN